MAGTGDIQLCLSSSLDSADPLFGTCPLCALGCQDPDDDPDLSCPGFLRSHTRPSNSSIDPPSNDDEYNCRSPGSNPCYGAAWLGAVFYFDTVSACKKFETVYKKSMWSVDNASTVTAFLNHYVLLRIVPNTTAADFTYHDLSDGLYKAAAANVTVPSAIAQCSSKLAEYSSLCYNIGTNTLVNILAYVELQDPTVRVPPLKKLEQNILQAMYPNGCGDGGSDCGNLNPGLLLERWLYR